MAILTEHLDDGRELEIIHEREQILFVAEISNADNKGVKIFESLQAFRNSQEVETVGYAEYIRNFDEIKDRYNVFHI